MDMSALIHQPEVFEAYWVLAGPSPSEYWVLRLEAKDGNSITAFLTMSQKEALGAVLANVKPDGVHLVHTPSEPVQSSVEDTVDACL